MLKRFITSVKDVYNKCSRGLQRVLKRFTTSVKEVRAEDKEIYNKC